MKIPANVISRGAAYTYGWLQYHATRADYKALTYGQWSYPEGLGHAVEHPEALRLRDLARRLFQKRNAIGRLLQGRGYTPYTGVRG